MYIHVGRRSIIPTQPDLLYEVIILDEQDFGAYIVLTCS